MDRDLRQSTSSSKDLLQEDVEVITSAYRLVSDSTAFDDLIVAWDKRLQVASLDRKNAGTLLHHVRAVFDMFDTVPVRRFKDPIDETIHSFSGAALVLTADGVVVDVNQAGIEQFDLRQGTKTDFSWVLPQSSTDFEAVRNACRRPANRQHAVVQIEHAERTELAEIFIIPRQGYSENLLALRVLRPVWSDPVKDTLDSLFDLTEAEIDICRLLFHHCDAKAVACERKSSIRTVRTQLSAIYAKTQTASQVDLMRLLAFICSRAEKEEDTQLPSWNDPFGREAVVWGKANRKISYSWMGDPDGQPVLLLHSLTLGYAMAPEIDKMFRREGLWVIALIRPGHGNSDAVKMDAVEAAAQAAGDLLQALEIRSCIAVGLGVSTVPLLALASQKPDRIRGVLSIGGFLNLSSGHGLNKLPLSHRTFFMLYKNSPWIMELFAKAGLRAMKREGVGWYLNRSYAESTFDLEIINRPEIYALIRNACSLSTAQGHLAFVNDLALFLHDWDHTLSRMHQPFYVYHGEHDPTAPVTDLKRQLAKYSNAKLTVIPHAGELIFYSNAAQMAQAIINFAQDNKA